MVPFMPASLWPGMVQTYSKVPAALGVNSRVVVWPGLATVLRALAGLFALSVGKVRSCSITPLFSNVILSGWPTFAWIVVGVNFRSVATTFTSEATAAAGAGAWAWAGAAAGAAIMAPGPAMATG